MLLPRKKRRVQKTDMMSMYCRRQEDITGVFRSSQCFEYKERLDECSVPVRRLNEEPAVRPTGNPCACRGVFSRSEQLMVGLSMVFQRLYAHRNDRYSPADVVQIGGSVLYLTAHSGPCSRRESPTTRCSHFSIHVARRVQQILSTRTDKNEGKHSCFQIWHCVAAQNPDGSSLTVGLASERTVREVYGYVQMSCVTDFSDKLSLGEPPRPVGSLSTALQRTILPIWPTGFGPRVGFTLSRRSPDAAMEVKARSSNPAHGQSVFSERALLLHFGILFDVPHRLS